MFEQQCEQYGVTLEPRFADKETVLVANHFLNGSGYCNFTASALVLYLISDGLVAGAWVGQLFGTLYHPHTFLTMKDKLDPNDPVVWLRHAVLVVDHQRCPLAWCSSPVNSYRRAQLQYHF